MRYQLSRQTLFPSNRKFHQGMIAILGSLVVLSVFMLLLGATTTETQTGRDERCNGWAGQVRALCMAAVSEGCFDGEESDECDALMTSWMEHCPQCAKVGVYPWAVCGSAYARCVFVTSQTFTANLGGLSGADSKCQELADAAGLSGTFKAWLSDSTTDARDRLAQAAVPYMRVDGVPIADNFADLVDGDLAAPLEIDEAGMMATGSPFVWTRTSTAGIHPSRAGCTQGPPDDPLGLCLTCRDWFDGVTGAPRFDGGIGSWLFANSQWTFNGANQCNDMNHVYCFEH